MFFEHIYKSWENMQKLKYKGMFSALSKLGISPAISADIGCGNIRMHPFRTVCVDVNKSLNPDIVASGSLLPFADRSFDLSMSIDSAHLFGLSELFRISRAWIAIGLPQRLYDELKPEMRKSGRMEFEATIEGKETESIGIWKRIKAIC